MQSTRARERRGGLMRSIFWVVRMTIAVVGIAGGSYYVGSVGLFSSQDGLPNASQGAEIVAAAEKVLPQVKFGEVSSEGWVELVLQEGGDPVETWYTFQVDTKSREITLYFALYNEVEELIATVKAEGYTQGEALDMAEVTLYSPDAPKRVLRLDREEGKITDTQNYQFQSYQPSIFPPQLRSGLVYVEVPLQDESGDTRVMMDRDLSGLLGSESLIFERSAPLMVEETLNIIEKLTKQIEEQSRRG